MIGFTLFSITDFISFSYCVLELYLIIISSVLVQNSTTLSSSSSNVNDILIQNYFLITLIFLFHPFHFISTSYILKNKIKLLIVFRKLRLVFDSNLIFISLLRVFELNICFLILDSISLNFGFNKLIFWHYHYLEFIFPTFWHLYLLKELG